MPYTELQNALNERAAQGLLRSRRTLDSPQSPYMEVEGVPCLCFSSNDYLGLACHPQLVEALQRGAALYGVGAGAAHLLSGHFLPHHRIEQELAIFVEKPAALLFSSGYMANLGVVQALVGKNDTVYADKLNHASLNDAMLLSRASLKRYRHNDMVQLEGLLGQATSGRKLILCEAVYSMDGDRAPLAQLLSLCDKYDAWLLLDDAHGFGVLGEGGRGSLFDGNPAPAFEGSGVYTFNPLVSKGEAAKYHSRRIIYMATLGKAAGGYGAFVAAEQAVIDTLINHARSYIYTTATPPALAFALLESLKLIAEGDALRNNLRARIGQLKRGLAGLRYKLMPSDTAIQPLLIGDSHEAWALSEALRENAIWVAAIRPPTVPQGSARLRITLSAAHSVEDVEKLIGQLYEIAQ